jgi:hypothetical protein
MAVALPPPTLLAIWKRTGSSFSFSIALRRARPRASLPPPGPVWTTTSTGLVGFHCAAAGDHAPTASSKPKETPKCRKLIMFLRLRSPALPGL